jgi:hypothetical protein
MENLGIHPSSSALLLEEYSKRPTENCWLCADEHLK